MAQKVENVDLAGNIGHPFQLMVPRKKKNVKQQHGANKGFKVGAYCHSPQ